MPLYEYQCNDCNERFDALVRSHDASGDVHCNSCSGDNVRRLISTFGVGGFDDPMVRQEVSSGGGCCGGSCGCCG